MSVVFRQVCLWVGRRICAWYGHCPGRRDFGEGVRWSGCTRCGQTLARSGWINLSTGVYRCVHVEGYD